MATAYYKLSPQQIVQDIDRSTKEKRVKIKGLDFLIYPHVYPSDQFRSSLFIIKEIEPLVHNLTVCDMGCGMGIIGQFALHYGAKKVVQADINPFAIENAVANKVLHGFSDKRMKIYESDCFSNIPAQKFDLIVFNIPFHNEPFIFYDPLERAFHDPGFSSLKKFLRQAVLFSHENTQILIVFSNKGDVRGLEKAFNSSEFKWSLWRLTNTDQTYDTRIYRLHLTTL